MRRESVKEFSPTLEREMSLIAYGHDGLPVLVFPSSEGKASDYEGFGMIDALAPLISSGKLRLYCVDSYDSESWYGRHRPAAERTRRHSLYEAWIMTRVIPAIARDIGTGTPTGTPALRAGSIGTSALRAENLDAEHRGTDTRLTTTGCSFGAYHAATFALKHPRKFKHALCMSGVYDIRFLFNGQHNEARDSGGIYFNNPIEFVSNLHGDLLDEIRRSVFISLICGQGQYEERCLSSTKELWWLLRSRQIPNYMDLWGHDVAHDWPWWRKQIAHFMSHLVEGRMPWPSVAGEAVAPPPPIMRP